MSERAAVRIGHHFVQFTPHYVPGVGPRVIVVDYCLGPRNLTTDDAHLYAAHIKIAADEAEAMARRALKQRPAA